jgi:MFS family permease
MSYAVFGYGSTLSGTTALTVLLVSRMLAGVCGANITVAQAYIADITPPEHRSKRMGLIGMAFGLGFIFGPILGGLAAKHFGLSGPGYVAAGFCAVNFFLATVLLKESRQPGSAPVGRRPRLAQWKHVMQRPTIGPLVLIFFLATFCFTCFETTLGLMVGDNFSLDLKTGKDAGTVTALFAFCGIVGALVQGGPVGRLVKKMGEPKLITLSLFFVAVSLAPIPFIRGQGGLSWGVLVEQAGIPWIALLFALALLAIGSGLTRPPLFGMLSILTPEDEQGATLGVAQSAGSFARIVGPIFAGGLFHVHPTWPYLACAGIAVLAGLLAWRWLGKSEPALREAKSRNPVNLVAPSPAKSS